MPKYITELLFTCFLAVSLLYETGLEPMEKNSNDDSDFNLKNSEGGKKIRILIFFFLRFRKNFRILREKRSELLGGGVYFIFLFFLLLSLNPNCIIID